MKYIIAPFLGFVITLLSLLCPILVIPVLFFIKWDDHPSPGQWGTHSIIRGWLPNWLKAFETPDEPLPGGMYEDKHRELYEKYGKVFASYVWIGLRNRLHGLGKICGKETTPHDQTPESINGFWEQPDGVWQKTYRTGPLLWVFGYQKYVDFVSGKTFASPKFAVKSRPLRK